MAVISEIMNSEYYDPELYGNSVSTMMIEWSAHNFTYHTAQNKLMYDFYQWRGYTDPVGSSSGVDFRKELRPSSRRKYNIVTLWGILQW